MTASSYRTGRLEAAKTDVLVEPRKSNGVGVIVCHGANSTALDWSQLHGAEILAALARVGYTCWAGDLGGGQTWGNDTSMTRVTEVKTALVALGCSSRVILLGASMGHLTALRWAADNPTLARAVVGVMPAVDIEDIRTRDALGSKTLIETAWSITTGTPVPARGVPLGRTAELAGIPWRAYYGEQDTVTTATAVRALGAALGRSSDAVQIDNTGLDHGTPLFNKMPADAIATWLLANAA